MPDVLAAEGLTKSYKGRCVADSVSFTVARGGSVGVVGESGSGKTTVARMISGLIEPDAGTVSVNGRARGHDRGRAARLRRAREIQMVFQDPYGSLDRRLTVGNALRDVLKRHRCGKTVAELMDSVGLAAELESSRPHQLSGGQRQRVAIAKALAVDPAVLVLDEAVSALDVSVQARILALLNEIRRDTGVGLVFVTHDLAVAAEVTDTLLVMYQGKVVEHGDTATVLRSPEHPYTEMLLSSAPGPGWRPEQVAELRAAFADSQEAADA
ncbi:ABC transporter ATP-binding protein [Actinosynnema sp. ALI-1.44]|uniref:ABC transporter ATP-binding protein n=1 Tax=Actinosynnema sp. ALI-1.44 TaxID=1933779 RepID=UPI00097C1C4C|nr:ATP-binding cassette domain-containing protein [Actinosynnema sp. ALI-1.44]ONI84134.1 ABC transporter ATP-binding protein [Actinosynnema sp. ALI-1.44]